MLRITEQRDAECQRTSLIVEGRLEGAWVEELMAYCRIPMDSPRQYTVIDLTGVTFIDAAGKAVLAQLWARGVKLRASGCLNRCMVEEITGLGQI